MEEKALDALWSTKSDIFNEEQEVRLLLRTKADTSGTANFEPLGTDGSGNLIPGSIYGPVLAKPGYNMYELHLEGLLEGLHVKKVIIGPRNDITIKELRKFMRYHGFNKVSVKKSVAKGIYRA